MSDDTFTHTCHAAANGGCPCECEGRWCPACEGFGKEGCEACGGSGVVPKEEAR